MNKIYIKINENNVITEWGTSLANKEGIEIETNLNIDIVDLCNYKYIDGQLIKLTEKEIQKNEVQTLTTEELLLKEIANLKIEIMHLKGGNI